MPLTSNSEIVLALETRQGNKIKNFYSQRQADDGDKLRVREFKNEYGSVEHRPVGPSPAYNCHGLTFGSRRTGIYDPESIDRILVEDGYRNLSMRERVLSGDVAVYRNKGEIIHSGIVVRVDGEPWILSKWGAYHEAIHKPLECPYNSGTVSYYRLEK